MVKAGFNSSDYNPLGKIPHVEISEIFKKNGLYKKDQNPKKVNLGIGMYQDDSGCVAELGVVRQARVQLLNDKPSCEYLPIEGHPGFTNQIQKLLFGDDQNLAKSGRVFTAQSVGGTGALRLAGDFIASFLPGATVHISDPTWENHTGTLKNCKLKFYPYYDPATRGVDFDRMTSHLRTLPAGDVVLLHACCHNPTGADLSETQWLALRDLFVEKGLVAFFDIAYQGFQTSIEADAAPLSFFTEAGITTFVAQSSSKNFALYDQRVGTVSIVTPDRDTTEKCLSQMKQLIRTNYSNPPAEGARRVEAILSNDKLKIQWKSEVAAMRDRIRSMRSLFAAELKKEGFDFGFIQKQHGMFSFTGLTVNHAKWLIENRSIYILDSGRACVAALNSSNIEYVSRSVSEAIKAVGPVK